MTPTRLVDHGDTLGARLLRAGRAEAPREGSDERVLVAVGLSLVGGAATTAAWWLRGWMRWLFLAVLAGGAGIAVTAGGARDGGGAGRETDATAMEVRTELALDLSQGVRLESRAEPAKEATPSSMATAPVAALPRLSKGSPSAAAPGDELERVRRAKLALLAHDASAALSILDGYARDFPRGKWMEEAEVVRIEALGMAGEHESASRAGEAFLKTYPASPYAQWVRGAVLRGSMTP